MSWVFVTDYGAVGDGVTDDTEAINRVAGIWFPTGTYVLRGDAVRPVETDASRIRWFATEPKPDPDAIVDEPEPDDPALPDNDPVPDDRPPEEYA